MANPPNAPAGYQRGFWALIATQFQGAFSDNFFKFFVIFYLSALYATGADGQPDEQTSGRILQWAGFLFAVPFLIFPGIAGAVADRYSKRTVTIGTKVLEVGVMTCGLLGLLLGAPAVLWLTLFLMATQSAFFSPAKYGILPEMLPESRLSWGNGIIQMATFVAIIAGTAVVGPLSDALRESGQYYLSSVILIVIACAGLGMSFFVTPVPPADPVLRVRINPWAGLGKYYKIIWHDRWLFLAMVGIAYFWFAGALVQLNIIQYGKFSLGLTADAPLSYMAAALALGIGFGALAAGFLSRGKIEVGLVPLGALGLAVAGIALSLPGVGYNASLVWLFVLGFFGGTYNVPLAAALQQRSPRDVIGGLIASVNVITFTGILSASLVFGAMVKLGFTPRHIFLATAIMTLLVGAYICWLLPVALLRFGLWVVMNTVYRIKVLNRTHLPETGGALLVANHTSYIDALVLTASTDRPIRFIMHEDIYNTRWIKPIAKATQAIPIASTQKPRDLVQSMKSAAEAVQNGELVCIFAEGQVSRTGQMLPFRKGFERIVKGTDVPVIPVHIDRLWGSIFSFAGERFIWKWPTRIPYPITVNYGTPMPNDSDAFRVFQRIQQLGTEAYMERKRDTMLLHRSFVKSARRNLRRLAMADQRSGELSFFKALVGSFVLARKLHQRLDKQPMVGLLVPPSVGGALCNIALEYMGRVPVNLNYTASADGLESSARQCEITQVLTSRAFLEKLPLQVPGEPVYLEDIMKSITKKDRIIGLLLALLCPIRLFERLVGAPKNRSVDDLATIIFSSGSEGDPKGVMLSHFNIASNVDAVLQVFPFNKRVDCMIGFLPFFHSFGFMATLWLPFARAFPVVFHPSPLEVKTIGELIHKYRVTFLVATPTFLQGFMRRCSPEELSSIKWCITGAEKLPERIRVAFHEKFGIEPLEGYGTTECAPAVAVNVPDFRAPGFYQKGTRHGTIGKPIPGVSVRTIDPDSGEELGVDEPGLLLVKGPNIMQGYLKKPEKTAEVLKDGWYCTGDVAKIDDEGFITITDRLSRFSKIAGEMVPHNKIEDTLHKIMGFTEQTFAVCGVPDEQKGERLVVLHTLDEGAVPEVLKKLEQSGLPNLWQPKSNAFHHIEALPVLGTGKMDIKRVKQLALEHEGLA